MISIKMPQARDGDQRRLTIACAIALACAWAGFSSADDPAALATAEKAVRDLEASGAQTAEYVARLIELGRMYRAAGEPVRSVETLEKAVRQSELILGENHPDTASALNNLAECALSQGDYDTARANHERALKIREEVLGKDHRITARSLNNLGLTLLESGDTENAAAMLHRALAINDRAFGADHRVTAVTLMNLGRAQFAGLDLDGAVASFNRAKAIRSASLGPRDPVTMVSQQALAEVMMAKGFPRDAEAMLDDVWSILRKTLGEQHPATLDALDILTRASLLVDSGGIALQESDSTARMRRRFYVRDFLGIDWRDQLLAFPIKASAGEGRPQRVRLDGPDGPVPVQLIDVDTWPDGTLRTARACFWVDLAAFHCDLYTLRFDDPAPDAPASRLAIDRRGERVSVRGRFIGAEFNLSENTTNASEHLEVSPPLVAMIGPDGSRFGGSEFFGPLPIEKSEAMVVSAGPVLAEVKWRYTCRGGLAYELRASIGERDTAVHWEMYVTGDAPANGWRIRLNNPGDELSFVFQKKAFSAFVDNPLIAAARELDWIRIPLVVGGQPITLAPWYQQYFDSQQTLLLLESARTNQTRFAVVRDADAWVEPRWPRRFTEGYPGRLAKSMPLSVADDGSVTLTAHCGTSQGGGTRRWAVGIARPDQLATLAELADKTKDIPSSMALGKWLEPRLYDLFDSRRLDRVKDYVLHWPRAHRHPSLFVTRQQVTEARARRPRLPGPSQAPQFPTFEAFVDYLAKVHDGPWYEPWHHDAFANVAFLRGDKSAAQMRIRDRLFHHLGLLGQIDRMRDAGIVAALYDGSIDTDMVSPSERRILDAWMAYLCYVYADPNVISYERGYHPGPPNITIAYVLSLGICACAIPDHPLARGWVDDVMKKVRYWLDEELGPEGEWFEGSTYDHVTLSQFLAFAIAMKNAGFEDLTRDPRLRLFAESLAQHDTPPDSMRQGHRVTPPLGRRVAGCTWAVAGLMSRMNAETDAPYSSRMQWAWQAGGNSYRFPDDRLGGMEMLLLDPALPAASPMWASRLFPRSDVLFRDAVGKANESYLLLPTHWNESLAPLQVGSVAKWFALGVPLGGAFSNGDVDRHQLLASNVVPAFSPSNALDWKKRAYLNTKGTVLAATMQPVADYLDATFTSPFPSFQGGADDATPGTDMPASMPAWPKVDHEGQGPVKWRRQLLFVKTTSDKTPSYVVLRDTVASDTPTMWLLWTLTRGLGQVGERQPAIAAEASPVKALQGDRFTAAGQFGVDLDYFVAAPQDTPRHTLRWGKTQNNPGPAVDEYQDLLHLQLRGSGYYFVVLFPRKAGHDAPVFEALAPGVIRLRGGWGEDIVFLGDDPVNFRQEGVVIDALAGVIRREGNTESICLARGGDCSTPRSRARTSETATERVDSGSRADQIPKPSQRD
ncbi:MAG: tetratricopeptide repeat protein [Planctomycetaceae bacterium]|nr:tetratricopeptide repeat protein [Planctomycetaceae bacterium]